MKVTSRFNLRVYAIIQKDDRILLADESIDGFGFTKFPGGGVEPGEGLLDALRREFREEGGAELYNIRHFYTTDFFQQSAFKPEDQIVSVYYLADADLPWDEFESDQSLPGKSHLLKLYFRTLNEISDHDMNFPIDKLVLEMLKGNN